MDGINGTEKPYQIQLPYVRGGRKGAVLYLDMNTAEHKNYVRSLILLNLMQYPSGKLNLIMIDPRTSGCFGGLARLGEDDASLIDTSVWGKASDIRNAISRLKDRISQLISTYGDDVQICLERENHQLLTIADFPQGFDVQALDDLSIIMESGANYGLSVIIIQNDEVMNSSQLSKREKELISRIKAKMIVIQYKEQKYYHTARIGEKESFCLYHFVDQDFFEKNGTAVIKFISEKLSDRIPDIIEFKTVHRACENEENWLCETTLDGINLATGTKGVSDIGKLVLGRTDIKDTKQHVLIGGLPGSGKTVLLHAIISSH